MNSVVSIEGVELFQNSKACTEWNKPCEDFEFYKCIFQKTHFLFWSCILRMREK